MMMARALKAQQRETVRTRNGRPRSPGAKQPEDATPEIHITQEGTYYAKFKGAWYEAELSYLRTPMLAW